MGQVDSRTGKGVEETPFIPYGDRDSATDRVELIMKGTEERMGFTPNSFGFYLHQPHVLPDLQRLNNCVMRHPSNVLNEEFKYRLAFIVSRNNGCRYCTGHEANTLKNKYGLDDGRLEEILNLENPEDEREAAAWSFADAASRGRGKVTDGMRADLARLFTPAEVVEIACTIGFWSMYNKIHDSLAVPLEAHLLDEGSWVEFGLDDDQ